MTWRWAPAPSIPPRRLRALGPKPWRAAYVQPSRRPTDGRYGENPNRLQHYYQFQVILKPSPAESQELYLDSLAALGIDAAAARHPLRRGRLGKPDAGRLGARLGGLARRHGSDASSPISSRSAASNAIRSAAELTYGLERLAMYIQGVENVYDLDLQRCRRAPTATCSSAPRREFSAYNFEHADTELLFRHFADAEQECRALLAQAAAAAGL